MPDIRIDSHKLLYHPQWVSDWLQYKPVYPLTVEVGLTNACNHRCIFCALDYRDNKQDYIDKDILCDTLSDMAKLGLKSVVLAGEGEPLLHPDYLYIARYCYDIGLSIGMSTNGVLLDNQILNYLSWIRFSVGGYQDNYQVIHDTVGGQYTKAMSKIDHAVRYKHLHHLPVTIGVQTVLLDNNVDDIIPLARLLKELEVDYYTVKPFSKHPLSKCNFDIDYKAMDNLGDVLLRMADDKFCVYFRQHCMNKKGCKKDYDKCYGIDSMSYIDARGDVWPCIAYLGHQFAIPDMDYDVSMSAAYGNISCNKFKDIFDSANKAIIADKINSDLSACREMCRLDEVNSYLHRLRHPDLHDNFI